MVTRSRLASGVAALAVSAAVVVHVITDNEMVATFCYLGVLVGASVGAWIGSARAPHGQRLVPRLIAMGLTLSALGDVLWSVLDLMGASTDVSIADPPFFASYVFLCAALWRVLVAGRDTGGARAQVDFLIDAGTIVAVSLLIMWSMSVGTIVGDDSVAPLERTVWAAYPIADAVLLALVVRTLMSRGARLATGMSFAVGACLWLAADIGYLLGPSSAVEQTFLDPAWMVGPVLMARAAWRSGLVTRGVADSSSGWVAQLVVAVGPLLVPPTLELIADLRGASDNPLRLFTGTAVVVGLAFVRTARLLRSEEHARRMLDAERASAVHDSLHDALTGMPNRTLLADRLEQALRVDARMGTSTGVVLLDLDRFKEINDTFGHHYGDEVLIQMRPRLAGVVREVDTVARLAGDEFVVLLFDVGSVAAASAVAAKLRAALESPFRVEGIDLDVEASAGVVVSGEHGTDVATLLQRADVAMYAAKAHNLGVAVYNPDFDEHCPAKLALFGDLRRALDRGELVLHYQPKVSIGTGEVVGVEALVRWQHPKRGMVLPDDFIPMAENSGLIGPLTRHVLDTALAQARLWSDAGWPLPISVNLSARSLLDVGLPGQVAELLAAHRVAAELLELEVTESAIMTEPVRAQHSLEQLVAFGVRISIDDFGVGHTSLSQLKNLPISELKIDRSFVLTMIEDPSNALIVRSVIDLGHQLGFTIVAEGVETQQILTTLDGLGCDVAQGYHLSRPLTAAAFDTWYARRRIALMRRPASVGT